MAAQSTASWLVPLIVGTGATAGMAYYQNRQRRRENEEAEASAENRDVRDVALQESLADPFRHQRSQLQNLTSLDMLRQFGSGGRRVTPPANVAPYAGQVRQGYKPSGGLNEAISALEQSIRGGQTAPTMTDPANFGRTSAVDINTWAGRQGGGVPGAGAAAAPQQRRDPMSYLPGQEYRRNEGAGGVGAGAAKGFGYGAATGNPYAMAGGALVGAIGGAFTKNAKTAMTDLSLEQAQSILDQVYQEELGRQASPEEIQSQIQGQGWKPGHRWVGEQGLLDLIRSIQNSQEARQRQYGAAA